MKIAKRLFWVVVHVVKCAAAWLGVIFLCEASGWWWFDDGLRAATWHQGLFSGPGPAAWWLVGYWLPVLLLFALDSLDRKL